MFIIITKNKEMTNTIVVYLPLLHDDWILKTKTTEGWKISESEFEFTTEMLFRYAEHFMYKEFFISKSKKTHLIPYWRKLPNELREKIRKLGVLLHSFYQLTIPFYDEGMSWVVYQFVRNEFKKNNYYLSGSPIKRNWIKEYKQKRSVLKNCENIFDENTPHLKQLLDDALRRSEQYQDFKVNILNKFFDNYKLWCDSISTDKNWYIKIK